MNNKIVLFTADFPYGKQETFLENEINYLASNFIEVTVVPLFGGKNRRHFTARNVLVENPVLKSRRSFSILDILTPSGLRVLFKSFKTSGPLSLKGLKKSFKQTIVVIALKKYLKKRKSLFEKDLWYFYWGTNAVNVLHFLVRHPKSVARFHRFDLYGADIEGGEPQSLQPYTVNSLKKAFFIAEDGQKYFEQTYGKKINTTVSRLGVPDSGTSSCSQDNVLRILTCSNIYPVKRVHLIADALKELKDLQIIWTHIGDGPKSLQEKLFSKTKSFPDNVSFIFKGRIPNTEVISYFQENQIDLFLNVSISEGLPVSIMEALSFGVPVMATKSGGVSELVTDTNGKVLPLDLTKEELCQELIYFYNNHFKDMQLRQAAKQSWRELVNAEINYSSFCRELKLL